MFISYTSFYKFLFQGLFINAFPCHNVPWLYDTVRPEHIEDKDDLWLKTWGTHLSLNYHGGKSKKILRQEEENQWMKAHNHRYPTSCTRVLQLISNVFTGMIITAVYITSTGLAGDMI